MRVNYDAKRGEDFAGFLAEFRNADSSLIDTTGFTSELQIQAGYDTAALVTLSESAGVTIASGRATGKVTKAQWATCVDSAGAELAYVVYDWLVKDSIGGVALSQGGIIWLGRSDLE